MATTSKVQGTIASEERLQWLGEQAHDRTGPSTIAAAAEALGVSEMTIRRDLAELEERGTARRVRGGARAIGPQTFADRRNQAARAKSRIAAKLADARSRDRRRRLRRLVDRHAPRQRARCGARPDRAHQRARHVRRAAGLAGRHGRCSPAAGSNRGPAASSARSRAVPPRSSRCRRSSRRRPASIRDAARWRRRSRRPRSSAAWPPAPSDVVLAVDCSKLGARAVAVGLEWDRVDILVTELDPADERLTAYRDLAELL